MMVHARLRRVQRASRIQPQENEGLSRERAPKMTRRAFRKWAQNRDDIRENGDEKVFTKMKDEQTKEKAAKTLKRRENEKRKD